MTTYYFDTSAIVKRYYAEKGTAIVDAILSNPLSQDRFITSFLTILEVTSSITRLKRSGQLTDYLAGEIFSRFRQDVHEHIQIVPLDNEIIVTTGAISMVEQYGLRSADAIHFATAIYVFSVIPSSTHVMVSSDRELLQAAKSSVIITLDPESGDSLNLLQKLRAGTKPDR